MDKQFADVDYRRVGWAGYRRPIATVPKVKTLRRYSSEAAQALMVRSEQLLEEWSRRINNLRADATARQVLPLLVEHPVVSSGPSRSVSQCQSHAYPATTLDACMRIL